MTGTLTPERMWRERLDQLEREFARLRFLLDSLAAQNPRIGGGFNQLLSELQTGLEKLTAAEAMGPRRRWGELATLTRRCRRAFEDQLELLGGLGLCYGITDADAGFEQGYVRRAEEWLARLLGHAGVKGAPVVVTGRGPLVELGSGLGVHIVRAPFLDWDLWHLPLLARSAGLIVAEEDARGRYLSLSRELLPQLPALLEGEPAEPLRSDRARQDLYLRHLFAEVFATALVGPAYAAAVLVLDLDYGEPALYGLEDPEQIEKRETAPRFLPSPVERAAAILDTLTLMEGAGAGAYAEVTATLETLAGEALATAGEPDRLGATRERLGGLHRELFEQGVRELIGIQLPATRAAWERAREWYARLAGQRSHDPQPGPGGDLLTELLGALWLHRLTFSRQADNVLRMASRVLEGGTVNVPYAGGAKLDAQGVARARLERMQGRWQRLLDILHDDRIRRDDWAAVAGRFSQLLSEQLYYVDYVGSGLEGQPVAAESWRELTEMESRARPVQREALGFLGGLLIHYRELDREPAALFDSPHDGPSICGLADVLLRELVRATGTNWNARTVLGEDPFLAEATDVVRVRFPDWSLWNLPIMAHEFGHIVARSTPRFLTYQRRQMQAALSRGATAAGRLEIQLEELFSDVFATYVLGPAFACDAVLLQFDPARAHQARGAYPRHEERVRVILQTLGQMSARTAEGAFEGILGALEHAWTEAVASAGAVPEDEKTAAARLARARQWGGDLYRLIDRFFRLGARYDAARWALARQLAKRLLLPPPPQWEELQALAGQEQPISLSDLLNALWCARMDAPNPTYDVERLTRVGYRLGQAVLGGA